jgi:hypothetical protein
MHGSIGVKYHTERINMVGLTYFKTSDAKCPCCGLVQLADNGYIIKCADLIREYAGIPLTISSGYRCGSYNVKLGGAKNSKHVRGLALDFTTVGVPKDKIYRIAKKAFDLGLRIGFYDRSIHIDKPDPGELKKVWIGVSK